MPLPPPLPVYATSRIRSFVASIEGQDVLLGAIASGFGHEDPVPLVAAARHVAAGWSSDRRVNLRMKIMTGQINVIGGHTDLKSALASLASALLGFRTPPARAFEVGKLLFVILDADAGDLDDWMRDVPPLLELMGCDRERLVLYVVGRLPS